MKSYEVAQPEKTVENPQNTEICINSQKAPEIQFPKKETRSKIARI